MFEYIIDKETKGKANETDVVGKIANKFETLDKRRARHLEIIKLMQDKLYLQNETALKYLRRCVDGKIEDYTADEDWKSHVDSNVLYSLAETDKAFLKETTYKNIEQLFDVEGENDEYDPSANIQKSYILNQLEEMGAEAELDKCRELSMVCGENNLFVGWCERYKTIKRPVEMIPQIIEQVNKKFKPLVVNGFEQTRVRVVKDDGVYATLRIPEYEGAVVKAISPENLVYDPDNIDNWDSCCKIVKEFTNANDVLNNKLYKLSAECKEWLKSVLKGTVETGNEDDNQKIEELVIGDSVEVLNFFGDWVQDGKMLKNWSIVVIARKYLALFEENRFVINPIINEALLRDPETKRGIPVLLSVFGITEMQNKLMNDYNDTSSLRKQPPCYAPKGFFDKLWTKIFPGKVLEYDSTMQDPKGIIPIGYDSGYDSTIIQYLSSLTSSISGIFPNMQGAPDKDDITATEIKTQVAGQTTRLQYQVDSFSKNLILPMIQKIADLNANNRVGDYEFIAMEQGTRVKKVINDEIRMGDYQYKYNDQSAIARKKAELNEIKDIVTAFAPVLGNKFKYEPMFEDAMTMSGFSNPNKYMKSDEEMAMEQMQVRARIQPPQTQNSMPALPQAPMANI